MKKVTNKKVLVNDGKSQLIEVIISTKDYNDYPLLIENRPIDKQHVKDLLTSFQEFGTAGLFVTVIESSSIDGIVRRYFGDGQHSREACKIDGLPLSIKVVKLENDTRENLVKYVATLNNSVKSWSTNNFLKSYCELSIKEYLLIQKTIAETKLTVTDMLYIFLGNGGKIENKLFKSGNLKFSNLSNSKRLLKAILMVKDVIPNKAFSRRSLYSLMALSNDYAEFSNAILAKSKVLKFSENEKEFKVQLNSIFLKLHKQKEKQLQK